MNTQSSRTVMVVGAGPTGLVLAAELTRRNVAVRVVDAADGPREGSRAKGLQPRSLELLYDLGVAGHLMGLGRSRVRLRRYEPDSAPVEYELNTDAREPSEATPYTRTMIIPQWQVETSLRQFLEDQGVTIEYSTRVRLLNSHRDSVQAVISRAGQDRIDDVAYVVGCDGAASTVRREIAVDFNGTTDESTRLLTADVRIDGLDRDFWHLWPQADGGLLALCPLPACAEFQLQMDVPDVRVDYTRASVAEMIRQRTKTNDIVVQSLGWHSVWRSNVRLVDRYRVGRVFLAGDAAHVHPPAGGLGMNTGMQDAVNLAWKLAHVLAGAPVELLDSYELERRPVAEQALGLSTQILSPGLAHVLSRQGQHRDTLQLNISYRTVLDQTETPDLPRPGAGDRAPDGLGNIVGLGPTRLFDLFKGTHITVLSFGKDSCRMAAETVGAYGTEQVTIVHVGDQRPTDQRGSVWLEDASGSIASTYMATDHCIIVVRPDGYIGVRSSPPNRKAIADYLQSLLGYRLFPTQSRRDT